MFHENVILLFFGESGVLLSIQMGLSDRLHPRDDSSTIFLNVKLLMVETLK